MLKKKILISIVALLMTVGTVYAGSCSGGSSSSCETGGKPVSLTFEYTGGGCTASDNDQGTKKASCSGTIDDTQPVDITAVGGKKGKDVYPVMPTFVEPVPVGKFTIAPTKFKSDSFIELTNAGGTETNKIHTSCSQPLRVGDVFGSLTLVAVAFNTQQDSTQGDDEGDDGKEECTEDPSTIPEYPTVMIPAIMSLGGYMALRIKRRKLG